MFEQVISLAAIRASAAAAADTGRPATVCPYPADSMAATAWHATHARIAAFWKSVGGAPVDWMLRNG